MQVIGFNVNAQNITDIYDTLKHPSFSCKVQGINSPNVTTTSPISNYLPSQIQHRGKIDLYFEDVLLSNGWGFDDPIVGLDRRNCMCALATYIQSVFDFSQVPSINPIRLEISQTYNTAGGFPAPPTWNFTGPVPGFNIMGVSTIMFSNIANTTPGYYGGYMYDKINNYTQYSAYNYNGFDGRITINLDGQAINEVYISYLRGGSETFSEADIALIENLALQCPYVGGTAVYKARNLFALYRPMQSYEDIDICNAVGVYKNGKGLFDDENALLDSLATTNISTLIALNTIKVYPNPATEQITFEYTALTDENSSIELFDLTGRKVKEIELPKNSNKVNLMVDNLAQGVYTYKQIKGGRQVNAGKIIIE